MLMALLNNQANASKPIALTTGKLKLGQYNSKEFGDSYYIDGSYTLSADAFVEIRDKGFYSPDVFQAHVNDQTVQGQAQLMVDLQFEFFGSVKYRYRGEFNLLQVGFGLQYYTPTLRTPEMCGLFYYNKEAMALHNRVDEHWKTCKRSSYDQYFSEDDS